MLIVEPFSALGVSIELVFQPSAHERLDYNVDGAYRVFPSFLVCVERTLQPAKGQKQEAYKCNVL
jgi:hypothetical protein